MINTKKWVNLISVTLTKYWERKKGRRKIRAIEIQNSSVEKQLILKSVLTQWCSMHINPSLSISHQHLRQQNTEMTPQSSWSNAQKIRYAWGNIGNPLKSETNNYSALVPKSDPLSNVLKCLIIIFRLIAFYSVFPPPWFCYIIKQLLNLFLFMHIDCGKCTLGCFGINNAFWCGTLFLTIFWGKEKGFEHKPSSAVK